MVFRERLGVPWWAWPVALLAALFLSVELTLGAPSLRTPPLYLGAALLAALGLFAVGRIVIAVRPDPASGQVEFAVDDARLPVAAIAAVTVITLEERRRLLGLDAEPLAFVVQRPWIPGGVRVDLDDPADPTPYWFVSSRRPEELAAALEAARTPARAGRTTEPSSGA